MKKVLCIGDSLSLPREGLLFEDTWLFNLKLEFSNLDFISVSTRGSTTNVLVSLGGNQNSIDFPPGSDTLEFYFPKFIILQLGIVDCAPRLILPGTFKSVLVKLLPAKFRDFYLLFLKKVSNRKRDRVYVDKEKFRKNILNYLDRCKKNKVEKVVIIAIAIPDKTMEVKNPEMVLNVNEYNSIYEDVCKGYEFVKLIYPFGVFFLLSSNHFGIGFPPPPS